MTTISRNSLLLLEHFGATSWIRKVSCFKKCNWWYLGKNNDCFKSLTHKQMQKLTCRILHDKHIFLLFIALQWAVDLTPENGSLWHRTESASHGNRIKLEGCDRIWRGGRIMAQDLDAAGKRRRAVSGRQRKKVRVV